MCLYNSLEDFRLLSFKKVDCFIITRFNLHIYEKDKTNSQVNTLEWLNDRFSLFDKYCFPSVRNQSFQDFYWICLFADDTPDSYRKRINSYHDSFHNFLPFLLSEKDTLSFHSYVKNIIKFLKNSSNILCTFRIDNDDSLKNDFLERGIEIAQSQKVEEQAYCFVGGCQYSVKDNLLLRIQYPYNHFCFLINKNYSPDLSFKYIFDFNHFDRQSFTVPYSCIETKDMWVEVIHDKNVVNNLWLSHHSRPVFSLSNPYKFYNWSVTYSLFSNFVSMVTFARLLIYNKFTYLKKYIF